MNKSIQELLPRGVWKNFYQITRIPRPSGHEARIPALVETSTNLAVVRSGSDMFEVQSLVRSSLNSARDDLCERVDSRFTLAGAKSDIDGCYPGWTPNRDSPILHVVTQVYQEIFAPPHRPGRCTPG